MLFRNQKKSESKKDKDVKLLTARNVMRPQVHILRNIKRK